MAMQKVRNGLVRACLKWSFQSRGWREPDSLLNWHVWWYVEWEGCIAANLSGTAIMILLPPQSFSGAVFLLSYLPVQIPNPIHTSFKEWQMSLKKYWILGGKENEEKNCSRNDGSNDGNRSSRLWKRKQWQQEVIRHRVHDRYCPVCGAWLFG